ncbi:MAG TPA: hypothetical protein IAB36_03610 [Candidatus Egerieicola pullicola]|uniref:Uncharacterized protein n=1 Tax=Candidatus Egerieicola pullicola TaxID=2840775 RepID=A0A9D1AJG6_9FIRM|nr:hypothetical protein [Candidatus Egerieicola pullicola]
MKIKIAYLPQEEAQAKRLEAFLKCLPEVKVKYSFAHPPFRHLYFETKIQEKT